MILRDEVAKRASEAGFLLPADVVDSLSAYFELLRRWNRRVSLTALPVEENGMEAIDRLLIEPIAAAKHLPAADSMIIDIGSGSGSPAIPMKLAAPQTSLRMVESKLRKAAFLREAARVTGLTRTEVDGVRFQELREDPAMRGSADVVTIRGVRVDSAGLMEMRDFIKPGGLIFLFRSVASPTSHFDVRHFTHLATHALLPQWGSRIDIVQKPK